MRTSKNVLHPCKCITLFATILLGGILGTVSPCLAGTLTFAYEGTVNYTQAFPGFPNSIHKAVFDEFLGQPLRLSFTFEDDPLLNPDRNLTDPQEGLFTLNSVTASIMGKTVKGTSGQLDVGNNVNIPGINNSADYFSVFSSTSRDTLSGSTVNGFPPLTILLSFYDPTGRAFDNDGLPQHVVDPKQFISGQATLYVSFGIPAQPYVRDFGEIVATHDYRRYPDNLIRVAPVPEPSTIALLGGGLIGLLGWRNKKKITS